MCKVSTGKLQGAHSLACWSNCMLQITKFGYTHV